MMALPFLMPVSAALAIAVLISLVAARLSSRLGPQRQNFQGKRVLASYGAISFPQMAILVGALTLVRKVTWSDAGLWLGTMGAMWALGLIDDLFGTREVGGFKGHFRKLLVERKLTTGAAKAVGGGIVGVVAGHHVSGGDPARWVAAAFAIPLTANVLNLVDLRPGRAVAVFFLGIGVTCLLAGGFPPSPWIVGTVAIVALCWGVVDSRGRAMMGDSGSNSLGAALGLGLALETSLFAQYAAIAVLIGIHWYSEKHSITALIEQNRVLRAIDRCLGVR